MAVSFLAISEHDTKELRKELNLPITKPLRFMEHQADSTYKEFNVTDYQIVEVYQPSGTSSLAITLEDDRKIRIISPFFSHMQKVTFVQDMISGKET